MGILSTRWETKVDGHDVKVSRNEWVRVLTLFWDGVEIAKKKTLVGIGELDAAAPGGVKVHVAVKAGSKCELTLDGKPVAIQKTH